MATKILCIDDEEDFVELLGTAMGRDGFEVETCSDPVKGLARLGEVQFGVVVMDLMMPGTSGMSLVEAVRGLAGYAQSPIFVLSAKILNDEERKFLMSSKVHFVAKPFSARQLSKMIRENVAL